MKSSKLGDAPASDGDGPLFTGELAAQLMKIHVAHPHGAQSSALRAYTA